MKVRGIGRGRVVRAVLVISTDAQGLSEEQEGRNEMVRATSAVIHQESKAKSRLGFGEGEEVGHARQRDAKA